MNPDILNILANSSRHPNSTVRLGDNMSTNYTDILSKFFVFKRNFQNNSIEVPINYIPKLVSIINNNRNFTNVALVIPRIEISIIRCSALTSNNLYRNVVRPLLYANTALYLKSDRLNPGIICGDYGVFTENLSPLMLIVAEVDLNTLALNTIKFKYDCKLFDDNATCKYLVSKFYTPVIKDLSYNGIEGLRTINNRVEVEVTNLSNYVEAPQIFNTETEVFTRNYQIKAQADGPALANDIYLSRDVNAHELAETTIKEIENATLDTNAIYKVIITRKQ